MSVSNLTPFSVYCHQDTAQVTISVDFAPILFLQACILYSPSLFVSLPQWTISSSLNLPYPANHEPLYMLPPWSDAFLLQLIFYLDNPHVFLCLHLEVSSPFPEFSTVC